MRTLSRPLFVAAIAATITPFSAHADDTYIGLNTTWSNPAAWSNNAPPTSTDNVFITPALNSGDTNTLTLDTSPTIANLTLGTPTGTTTLTLANNSLTASTTILTAAAQLTGGGSPPLPNQQRRRHQRHWKPPPQHRPDLRTLHQFRYPRRPPRRGSHP